MDMNTLTEAFLEKARECQYFYKNQSTETLEKLRYDLEPYIWQYFMFKYGPKLDSIWKTHTFPEKSRHAWVIVERRCQPNMWFLLRNIAWAAPHLSLYIFCSDENYEFIKALLGDKVKTVHIIKWFKGFATRQEGKDQYAQTFKLPGFYKHIDAEYMLRAEPDTYLRHKIPDSIFTSDFYGAPWNWNPDMPGGGGIHVRKIKTMIDLCSKFNNIGLEGEDAWLGEQIMENKYTFPDFDTRKNIFSENFPVDDPIGVHQFWTFIHNFDIQDTSKFKDHITRYLTIHIDE